MWTSVSRQRQLSGRCLTEGQHENSWECRAAAAGRPRQSQTGMSMSCECKSQICLKQRGRRVEDGEGPPSMASGRSQHVTTATAPKAQSWRCRGAPVGRPTVDAGLPRSWHSRTEWSRKRRTTVPGSECSSGASRAPRQIAPSVVRHQPLMGCAVCVGRAPVPCPGPDRGGPGMWLARLRCAELASGGPKREPTTTTVAYFASATFGRADKLTQSRGGHADVAAESHRHPHDNAHIPVRDDTAQAPHASRPLVPRTRITTSSYVR